ncbi:MAG: nucleotidyltransferase domain-containing protein [Candidatus Latescibacterota bacterium]
MRDRILHELFTIEQQEDVRILYACESGSRAWDFASPESDYDVRFLYARHPDWYLSIDLERRRDVIERPIEERLDINGWDLRKALRLLLKSNPPLLEWLHSPVVYLDRYGAAGRMRQVAPEYYSPPAARYHYLHMASGNIHKYLGGETVSLQKYFYILRPLLAVRWVDEGRGIAPVKFAVLLDAMIQDDNLKQAIESLLRRKRNGEDLDDRPHIPIIRDFITREMERLTGWEMEKEKLKRDAGPLNIVFREILGRVWGEIFPAPDCIQNC